MANQTVNLGPVRGENGTAASIQVGSVTTGEPGTPAKVVNSGTSSTAILDFTIPKGSDGEPGAKGDPGAKGEPGNDGKSPYQVAVEQGYAGTEAEFYAALVSLNDAPFLPLSGGIIAGDLQVNYIGNPDGESPIEMTSINIQSGFRTDGDVPFDLRGCVINGVNDPSLETDAANKRYVDQNAGVPIGCIVLWSGSSSNIPSGWHLCDGQHGTPDLRDRFVVGAGNAYTPGATGGNAQVTLTKEQLPAHTHTYDKLSAITKTVVPAGGSIEVLYDPNNVTSSTGSTGSGAPVDILPPYYALCYIMRIS